MISWETILKLLCEGITYHRQIHFDLIMQSKQVVQEKVHEREEDCLVDSYACMHAFPVEQQHLVILQL